MGFLDKLRGSSSNSVTTRTTISEKINVSVPAAQATAVQHGLERWAQSKGWAAVVTAEGDGDNVKLSLEHDATLPGAPPKIDASELAAELQQVVSASVKKT